MKLKLIVFINGQRYESVATKKHKTKAGHMVRLIVMESYCPDCAEKFETCTTLKRLERTGALNRRCDKCKSPRRHVDWAF